MAEHSKIGWTHHTMNFWWGCNKVSEECRHCYIAAIMRRAGVEPFGGPIRTKNWTGPKKWNRKARSMDVRYRVFTCSMSDFFHAGADAWRDEAWDLIRSCQHLDWLILTKRPQNIAPRLPTDWGRGYPNVWLGVTVGVRESLWRLDYLKSIPAHLRFVSAEPLLESIDFRPSLPDLDWVITGCEQAHKEKRRLMELDWVREIDQHCREAGVAHFFKQYYRDNKGCPCLDGFLDGEVRQQIPSTGQMTRHAPNPHPAT